MSINKSYSTILAATAVAAGSTKTSPGATSSPVTNCTVLYGGSLTWSISNSATLTTGGSLTFQVSGDGSTNWRDLCTVGGDLVNGSFYTGTIDLPRGVGYLRVIAYGNVGGSVTYSAELNAVTSL
jgi:hypothetical protein